MIKLTSLKAPLPTVSTATPVPSATAPLTPTALGAIVSAITTPTPAKPVSVSALGSLTPASTLNTAISPAALPSNAPSAILTPPAVKYDLPATLFDPNDIVIQPVHREHANFDPFGDVTGLSNQRPALVATTCFEPVFVKDAGKNVSGNPFTVTGQYMMDQYLLRRLIEQNIRRLLSEMGTKEGTFPTLRLLTARVLKDFTTAFRPVGELMNALNSLEQLKKSFEIRRYATYDARAYKTGASVTGHEIKLIWNVPTDLTKVALDELFTSDLHFRETSYRQFANTKVVYQLMYELQHFVKNHSYDLIRFDSGAHSRDDTTIQIVKNFDVSPKYSVGYLERFQGITASIKNLDELYVTDNTDGLIKKIKGAVSVIGKELPTNLPDRLTLLLNLLSKEYRISSALGHDNIRGILSSYGIDASSTTSVMDQVVGDIPDRITDVLRNTSDVALTNAVQILDKNVAVLPFEQHHIDSENGDYTPGSEYLVDSIINDPTTQFDPVRLRTYDSQLRRSSTMFDTAMMSLNIIDPALKYSKNGAARSDLFFARMLSEFARATYTNGDLSAGKIGGQNEMLVATIALCQKDETLRSLLMSLFLMDELGADTAKATASDGSILPGYLLKQIAFQADIIDRIAARVNTVLRPTQDVKFAGKTISGGGTTTSVLAGGLGSAAEKISTFPATPASAISPFAGDIVTDRPAPSAEFMTAFTSEQFGRLRALFKDTVGDFVTQQCYAPNDATWFSKTPSFVIRELVMETLVTIASMFGFCSLHLNSTGDLQLNNDPSKTTTFKMFAEKLAVVPDIHDALDGDLAAEADSYDPQVRIIARKLLNEENAIKKLYLALSGILTGVTGASGAVLANFAPGTGKHTQLFNEISAIVHPSFISLIDEAQVRLAICQTLEINSAFELASAAPRASSAPSFGFIDGSVPTVDVLFALWSLLTQPQFQNDKAGNMRVLSVGIPAGFSKKLQERVRLSNVKDNVFVDSKQKDVVRVKVYKRSQEFPDLVFKPKEFLFELSRFVSPSISFRNLISKDEPSIPEFSTLVDKVRTINIEGNVDVQSLLFKESNTDLSLSEYDFLSQSQKRDIVRNHVTSTLLELYGRLLTGVNLNEQAFLIDPNAQLSTNTLMDAATLKGLIDSHVKAVAKLDNFDSSVDDIDQLNLSTKVRDKLNHDLKHLHALAFSRTTFSDPSGEVVRALTPKIFERTFQIPVDPDDFDIDVTKTTATAYGRDAFHRLVGTGQVVENTLPSKAKFFATESTYRLNDRNNRRGTVTLEQYFVTIETVLGTEV